MTDRWPPTTLDELQRAIANGLLEESHVLDLKKELPPPPRNSSLAIDLAAFSIDGGVIFVGIDEDTSPPSIVPQPFEGLAERIEQIGLASVDQPVRVRCIRIEIDPGEGVLVVVVPPSALAPHMVDGRYRARGDRTNFVMTDTQVTAARRGADDDLDVTEQLLRAYVDNVTTYNGTRTIYPGPVLFVIARPLLARDDLVLNAVGSSPFDWITVNLLRGPLTRRLEEGFAPDFLDGLPVVNRASGWAIPRQTDSRLDIEILEDGTIRLSSGGLDYDSRDPGPTVRDFAVNGLVRRVILTAAAISELTSYFGPWHFSIALAPLRGRIAETARRTYLDATPYSEEGYEETAGATFEELLSDPIGVQRRLLGRLNRGFSGNSPLIPK